jgi:hypothetical protein
LYTEKLTPASSVAIAGAHRPPLARPHQETPGTFADLLDAFIADLTRPKRIPAQSPVRNN